METLKLSAVDVAGNESAFEMAPVKPGLIELDVRNAQGERLKDEWSSSDVTIAMPKVDVFSGVARYEYFVSDTPQLPENAVWTAADDQDALRFTQSGARYVFVRVVSNLGIVSEAVRAFAGIDKTQPQIERTQQIDDGWTNQDVEIHFGVSKAGVSGQTVYVRENDGEWLPLNEGQTIYAASHNGAYTFKAVTGAGNEAQFTIDIWHIDKDAPKFPFYLFHEDDGRLMLHPPKEKGESPETYAYSIDGGKRVCFDKYMEATLPAGEHELRLYAHDAAGNVSTQGGRAYSVYGLVSNRGTGTKAGIDDVTLDAIGNNVIIRDAENVVLEADALYLAKQIDERTGRSESWLNIVLPPDMLETGEPMWTEDGSPVYSARNVILSAVYVQELKQHGIRGVSMRMGGMYAALRLDALEDKKLDRLHPVLQNRSTDGLTFVLTIEPADETMQSLWEQTLSGAMEAYAVTLSVQDGAHTYEITEAVQGLKVGFDVSAQHALAELGQARPVLEWIGIAFIALREETADSYLGADVLELAPQLVRRPEPNAAEEEMGVMLETSYAGRGLYCLSERIGL